MNSMSRIKRYLSRIKSIKTLIHIDKVIKIIIKKDQEIKSLTEKNIKLQERIDFLLEENKKLSRKAGIPFLVNSGEKVDAR